MCKQPLWTTILFNVSYNKILSYKVTEWGLTHTQSQVFHNFNCWLVSSLGTVVIQLSSHKTFKGISWCLSIVWPLFRRFEKIWAVFMRKINKQNKMTYEVTKLCFLNLETLLARKARFQAHSRNLKKKWKRSLYASLCAKLVRSRMKVTGLFHSHLFICNSNFWVRPGVP